MARVYYQVSGNVNSNHFIKYKFECEYCGKDSGALTRTINYKSELNATNVKLENTPTGVQASKESLNEHKGEAASIAKMVYQFAKKGNYSGFEAVCPNCKKRQSWGYCIAYAELAVFQASI